MSDAAASASAPAGPSRARRAAAVLAGAAGLLVAAAYLSQFMRLAPWDPDGGLILGYVDQVAHGERAYFDFVDVYGPLNWFLPAWFYRAYGEEVWGIRVMLLGLKLVSVTLVFELVRRLAHPFHAVLAAAWTTLLLGLPWPYLQTAFSFHQVLPLVLSTWLLLLVRPLPGLAWNVGAAAVAVTLAIWLKVNTGLFLLAAGLLFCFCWLPATAAGPDGPRLAGWAPRVRAAQGLGIAAYGLAFAALMREHFDRWFLLYLAVPLALALLAAALRVAAARRAAAPVGGALRAWALLLGGVLALSTGVVLLYFGPSHFLDYARELAAVLAALEYAHTLPPLGEPGTRLGFNEHYWLQLPWLVTVAYVAWWLARGRRASGDEGERSALHGLFLFVALGGFVVYSRADESHVFQAVVPAVPALFVYLAKLEGAVAPRLVPALRGAVALAAAAWGSTLYFAPPAADGGAWSQPSMRLIHQRPHPHQRSPNADALLRRIDEATDETARYLDAITEDGDEVLVLTRAELLNFLSHTRPAGGRYKYVLYLAKSNLLDREGLEALLPPQVLGALISDPPDVIVGALQESYLLNVVPELQRTLDARYHVARRFGGIRVFVRDGSAAARAADSMDRGAAGPETRSHPEG